MSLFALTRLYFACLRRNGQIANWANYHEEDTYLSGKVGNQIHVFTCILLLTQNYSKCFDILMSTKMSQSSKLGNLGHLSIIVMLVKIVDVCELMYVEDGSVCCITTWHEQKRRLVLCATISSLYLLDHWCGKTGGKWGEKSVCEASVHSTDEGFFSQWYSVNTGFLLYFHCLCESDFRWTRTICMQSLPLVCEREI